MVLQLSASGIGGYRATTQLLTAADIFLPGEELPKLLEIDVRGDVGGIRELLGEYIRTVKGGTIEPHVNNNWKIVGNNWKAADHQKAVQLLDVYKRQVLKASLSRPR